MDKVLVLGLYRFPHGDAPSNRILGLSKTIMAAGMEPFVVAYGEAAAGSGMAWSSVDGVRYTSIRSHRSGCVARAAGRVLRSLSFARVADAIDIRSVRCVYTTLGTLSPGLILLCRRVWHRPLIVDCMEWFEPSQFRLGVLSPTYLAFALKFHYLRRNANVICISTTLCSEFRRRGARVLHIPPQVDASSYAPHAAIRSDDRMRLFYAGTAARKDNLAIALHALASLSEDQRSRIQFTIAGPTRDEVVRLIGSAETSLRLRDSVNVLGRISREDVLRWLSESHFTVLVRPTSRYSNAGFPSKIPESLAAGTPPITNITSDLGHYLRDGENSIVVKEYSNEAVRDAFARALAMTPEQWTRMSASARRLACDVFDFANWTDGMKEYLRSVDE